MFVNIFQRQDLDALKRFVPDILQGTLRKVLRYIKKYWVYLALSIVMAALTVTLTLYLPILTGRVIDGRITV